MTPKNVIEEMEKRLQGWESREFNLVWPDRDVASLLQDARLLQEAVGLLRDLTADHTPGIARALELHLRRDDARAFLAKVGGEPDAS